MNLFFDLDGTLLNARERYYRVYADVLQDMGFQPLNQDDYWKYKRTVKSEKIILEYSKAGDEFEKYYDKRTRRMEMNYYMRMDSIWPEIKPVLPYISQKHICSLITLRMYPQALRWELDHLGITSCFYLIMQPDTGFGTPITAETKTRVMREQMPNSQLSGWIIGDTDVDVLTGKELGLKTAAVGFGMQDADFLKQLKPDKFLETPRDLAFWLLNLYP